MLAQETGGQAFVPAHAEDLTNSYRQIAHELTQQYWLAFAPAPGATGYRRVSVMVPTQPQMRARTRIGDYAKLARPRPSPAGAREEGQ
jgi:hypothetical protein